MEEKDRENWVGENRLYFGQDNILYVTIVGETEDETAVRINDTYLKLLTMFEEKMDVFIDLNNAGHSSSATRQIWKKMTENERTRRVAFFGMHPVAWVLASFTMGVSKNKDMRFFKSKDEALVWLKG